MDSRKAAESGDENAQWRAFRLAKSEPDFCMIANFLFGHHVHDNSCKLYVLYMSLFFEPLGSCTRSLPQWEFDGALIP